MGRQSRDSGLLSSNLFREVVSDVSIVTHYDVVLMDICMHTHTGNTDFTGLLLFGEYLDF